MKIFNKKIVNSLKYNPRELLVTSNRYRGELNGAFPNAYLIRQADLSETTRLIKKITTKNYDRVIAFGSGKVIDTAKYSSHVSNVTFTAIPACLSTNCHFTDKSTLFSGKAKRTLDSKVPDEVVFDWGYIKTNSFMNNCGVLELLSSLTALTDWKIADRDGVERINQNIYNKARRISLRAKEILNSKRIKDLKIQSELLKISGGITVEYGCGRPVSGSEHIISALIENKYRCAHGVALSIAIPIALRLQKAIGYKEIVEGYSDYLIKKNPFRDYILAKMDKETVEKLLSDVVPRHDRYTVIDKIDRNKLKEIISATINDIFV